MSGPDFQQQLQKAGHQIPIIFITGDGDLLMTVEAMKFGALELLTKRFEGQILLDKVKQIQPATPFVANKGRMSAQRVRFDRLTRRECEVMGLVVSPKRFSSSGRASNYGQRGSSILPGFIRLQLYQGIIAPIPVRD